MNTPAKVTVLAVAWTAIGALTLLTLTSGAHIPSEVVASGPQQPMKTVDLDVGTSHIRAEVAANEQDREHGLMDRPALARDHGMLFVFDDSQERCFWMHNTLIPLSVAFIDPKGVIIRIAEMQANTDDAHCSNGAAKYVLEMDKQWFAQHGIQSGEAIAGPKL